MSSDADAIAMFRDSAADYLAAQDPRRRARALETAGGGVDRAEWSALADLGWFSVRVPEAAGGLGLGLDAMAAIVVEAGRHGLPEPLVDAGVWPLALLARLPASPLRDNLLADLMSGSRLAGVAAQTHAGEIDLGPGEARVNASRDGLRLTGHKRFVRPSAGADGWIVSAADAAGQPVLLWVAADASGLTCTDAAAVDGQPLGQLQCQAAPATLLASGPVVLQALATATDEARLMQAAELAGIARRAFELTLDYLLTRKQFGRAIGSFQALQHRMVDALIQVELAEAGLRQALVDAGDATDAVALARAASRAKARSAHAASEVTRLAVHLHGAIGTTDEHDIGLYFKRALALSPRLGTPGAHRLRFARLRPADTADDTPTWTQPDFPRTADWAAMPEPAFRGMLRAFLARHYPPERRHLPYRQTWAQSREWYMTLSRQGWLAPGWPAAHGGMGLPPDKRIAYLETFEQHGVARPPDQGLVMVGPILMRFGTDAQRARWLPPILAGEHVWTQGYSEPDAGSDLAALRTEAVLDGEYFVVNGQKTWTTWGADGTHMFMLVRTDKTVKKQAGISFLLVDLKTPGITVRPIRNIAAEQEFCEVFFDNVRVPRENLVGELNQGWTIAKALLGFERLFTGSPKHALYSLGQLERLARQRGLLAEPGNGPGADPAFRDRWARLLLDTEDLRAAYTGFAELAKRGEAIPPTISLLKIWSTETFERIGLELADAAAEHGAMRDHVNDEGLELHLVAPLFNALGAKIFAGSNEIQRNIVARQVLGLPDA